MSAAKKEKAATVPSVLLVLPLFCQKLRRDCRVLHGLDSGSLQCRWNVEASEEFELLKECWVRPPILAFPIWKGHLWWFYASLLAVRASFVQKQESRRFQPIQYAKRVNTALLNEKRLKLYFVWKSSVTTSFRNHLVYAAIIKNWGLFSKDGQSWQAELLANLFGWILFRGPSLSRK